MVIYTDNLISLTDIRQAVRRKGDNRGLKASALILSVLVPST